MHASIQPHPVVALSLLALTIAVPAHAATVQVTNCKDHGAGSLRQAAAMALDEDTIDLRGLSCPRILLTSGPILFEQRTITLQGPGQTFLAIDGGGRSGVLRHDQAGSQNGKVLRVRDLTVLRGRVEDPLFTYGGCVYSAGNIELVRVSVHDCVAAGPRAIYGAGVASRRNLRVIQSEVYANRAIHQSPDSFSYGGGVYGAATVLLDHSRISDNKALVGGGGATNILTAIDSTVTHNFNGGFTTLTGTVERSTFSYNTRYGLNVGGGRVSNSTFSSNGGPGLSAAEVQVLQNTIAYNTVARSDGACRGGLAIGGGGGGSSQLRGNLVAHNTCDGMPLDFTSGTNIYEPSEGNLIMHAGSPVPAGTLSADPHLLPLSDNGGPTLTHAIAADSVAIDAGSEADVGLYDQRDSGFPRRVGSSAFADIGAFERQQP